MIFRVGFSDGSSFNGGENYKDTLWNNIPEDKEIKQIAFSLPDGNLMVLRGYEKYNHIVEATQEVYGGNKFVLRYQYLMGKLGDKIVSYRITLFEGKNNRYRLGDLTRRELLWGQEDKGKPSRGWKKGIIN